MPVSFYTIYYGFKKYQYTVGSSILTEKKLAKRLNIFPENVSVGVYGFPPMYDPLTQKNPLMLLIGRIIRELEDFGS